MCVESSTLQSLFREVFLTIVTGVNALSGSTWKDSYLGIEEKQSRIFASGESSTPLLP